MLQPMLSIFDETTDDVVSVEGPGQSGPAVTLAPGATVALAPNAAVALAPCATVTAAAATVTTHDAPTNASGQVGGGAASTATTAPSHLTRVVADSNDRVAWLRARSRGITATDVAKLATIKSVRSVAWEKLNGSRRYGSSAYLEHGREREPIIAEWMLANHDIEACGLLFHARGEPRHLATPDGLTVRDGGRLELAEIKTTVKPWRSIPRHYLRQVWWQQYVLGAERTLVVWEQHEDFVPVGEPQCRWVDRDNAEIGKLVGLADQLLSLITPSPRRR